MNSLALKSVPHAVSVRCTDDELVISLNDGRVLSVPLAWFPRLTHASDAERLNFELPGDGDGIHSARCCDLVDRVGTLRRKTSRHPCAIVDNIREIDEDVTCHWCCARCNNSVCSAVNE